MIEFFINRPTFLFLYMCPAPSFFSHLCSFCLLCSLWSTRMFFISSFFHLSLPLGFFLPGEAACKHIFRIPLCNLVGRSIERPLKSPLVNKVLTTPASVMVPAAPLISATHSLSLSRMEIKEIASRTRKELLGKPIYVPFDICALTFVLITNVLLCLSARM